MLVKELIGFLKQCDPAGEVIISRYSAEEAGEIISLEETMVGAEKPKAGKKGKKGRGLTTINVRPLS